MKSLRAHGLGINNKKYTLRSASTLHAVLRKTSICSASAFKHRRVIKIKQLGAMLIRNCAQRVTKEPEKLQRERWGLITRDAALIVDCSLENRRRAASFCCENENLIIYFFLLLICGAAAGGRASGGRADGWLAEALFIRVKSLARRKVRLHFFRRAII